MPSRHTLRLLIIIGTLFLGIAGRADGQTVNRGRANETRWLEGPLDSRAVDWSLFPKAYGILASERLMQPVDLADWPVKIGSKRQLFVDNNLVASAEDVRRTIHQPTKHSGNPVLQGVDTNEGGTRLILLQADRDLETGLFQVWYTTRYEFHFPGTEMMGRFPTLYAESRDGINWRRPNLGLLEVNGSKRNNWVLYGRMYGLMHNPDESDPSRRYLAAVLHEPPYAREGLYLYASPDKLRWTRIREEPIVAHKHKSPTFPLGGFDDTTIVRWDQLLGKFVCDAEVRRSGAPFRGRCICTSDDLIHWSAPRMTIFQDAIDDTDAQVYGHVAFPYESMWIGFPRLLRWERTGWKQVEVELSASRDGVNWVRIGDTDKKPVRRNWSGLGNRPVFLPLGGPDDWDRDFTDVANNGPILVGDELWFFYRGSRNLRPDGKNDWIFAVGLAKLRRDGFVSIDAGTEPGTLTTRPLTLSGNTLHINATASGGSLKVGLAGMDGKPLPGFGIDDCVTLVGDGTDQIVRWKEKDDLSAAKERAEHIRLQFEMTNAELYSFWVK
jgi:hypothetical protein